MARVRFSIECLSCEDFFFWRVTLAGKLEQEYVVGRKYAHLHRERLEAHETKILHQLADRHVQCSVPRRGGRQRVFEMREVLHFGVII